MAKSSKAIKGQLNALPVLCHMGFVKSTLTVLFQVNNSYTQNNSINSCIIFYPIISLLNKRILILSEHKTLPISFVFFIKIYSMLFSLLQP